ncbi:hypothetical protein LIER_38518 [Lithospermum erythrorhizon]|uniref:Uncharacterized protein n=1 Tax=Lithospermum erythrorhizon TaxID=34254 RepID=A0AAV3Q117_LITER
MMKRFMWKGTTAGKYLPKVSWKQATLRKEVGGLRIKSLYSWNLACMAKHVWNICMGKEALWVKWISTFREILKSYVKYHIGNGRNINCLFDNWSFNGVVADFLSDRSISTLQVACTDSVVDLMRKVKWLRVVWDCIRISQAKCGGEKSHGSKGMFLNLALSAGCCALEDCQQETDYWAGELWMMINVAIARKGRLITICSSSVKTNHHLVVVWRKLVMYLNELHQPQEWSLELQWIISKGVGKSFKSRLLSTMFGLPGTRLFFNGEMVDAAHIVSNCVNTIRFRVNSWRKVNRSRAN